MSMCWLRREKKWGTKTLKTSSDGKQFILRHETQKGTSEKLHWPRGNSGVTIGPGYDMKQKDKATICSDMMQLGIKKEIAEQISLASHLSGLDARRFIENNENIVILTYQQQINPLEMKLPEYETIVRRNIKVPLAQHEFDALVSFVYNPGGTFIFIAQNINRCNIDAAMKTIRTRVASKNTKPLGLTIRRQNEIELFTNARYK